eukprot:12425105-Karenia_brevis.AAC.1
MLWYIEFGLSSELKLPAYLSEEVAANPASYQGVWTKSTMYSKVRKGCKDLTKRYLDNVYLAVLGSDRNKKDKPQKKAKARAKGKKHAKKSGDMESRSSCSESGDSEDGSDNDEGPESERDSQQVCEEEAPEVDFADAIDIKIFDEMLKILKEQPKLLSKAAALVKDNAPGMCSSLRTNGVLNALLLKKKHRALDAAVA